MCRCWARKLVFSLVFAGSHWFGAALPAQSPAAHLELDRSGETIVLEPYAPNILRVTLSLHRAAALAGPGYGFVASPSASGWSVSWTKEDDVYRSARIVATVERDDASGDPPLRSQVDIARYFDGSQFHPG